MVQCYFLVSSLFPCRYTHDFQRERRLRSLNRTISFACVDFDVNWDAARGNVFTHFISIIL